MIRYMNEQDELFDNLLSEYFNHTISVEDREKIFSMITESTVYKEKYEKAAKLNALLHLPVFENSKYEDYQLLREKGNINSTNSQVAAKTRKFIFLRYAAAAVVLILMTSLVTTYIYKSSNQNVALKWISNSTPLGGQTKVELPDGSTVWINAKTNLRYSSMFGLTDREIYLDGEAYFEVHKNKELPFSVFMGNMKVTATGTQFNISSYSDDKKWEVDLLEGGVNVTISDKTYSLIPDEKIVYDRTNLSATIEKTDAKLAARWTQGKLNFYQASIPEICKMLERHFNVKIIIDSEELKDKQFFGSINMDMSLREILEYLDVDKKHKIEIKEETVIIKRK